MMTRMTGVLTRVLDDEVRVQVGPFEYQVLVPEAVRRVIQLRTGTEITFHVTEYLEGNSGGSRFVPRRLGFLTEAEVDFFDLFCTVEKIGAKKALKAMARPVREIADAIARQDVRWLSTLPGIGATTAEQIVTTLKRKVAKYAAAPGAEPPPDAVAEKPGGRRKPAGAPAATPAEAVPVVVEGQVIDDVYQALMGLGHSPIEARGKLDALLSSGKAFANVQDALAMIYAQKG
jgi:Holliday junction DNA helicase RuvA